MRAVTLAMVAASVIVLSPALGEAAGYTFTKVVDDNVPRPDGKGNFNVWYFLPPSLDGSTVLVQNYSGDECNQVDSLWAAPVAGGVPSRLVAVGDSAPRGKGAFSSVGSPFGAVASNGLVAFQSQDQSGPGIYTLPLSGGVPQLVISYRQNMPSGRPFGIGLGRCEFTMDHLRTDGTHIAIDNTSGELLLATVGRRRLVESVDTHDGGSYPLSPRVEAGAMLGFSGSNPCSLTSGQGAPSAAIGVSGGDLVFVAGGSGAGGTTSQLFRTDLIGFRDGPYADCGYPALLAPTLAYYDTAMPNDPNTAANGFTTVSVDDDAATGTREVAYIMFNWTDNYQCVVRQNTNGRRFNAVACSNTLLPGMTTLPLHFTTLTLKDGTLAFIANDSASPNPNWGLYVQDGRRVRKVIASGDALDGSTVVADWRWPALVLSPRGTSGGAIAFYGRTAVTSGNYVAAPN